MTIALRANSFVHRVNSVRYITTVAIVSCIVLGGCSSLNPFYCFGDAWGARSNHPGCSRDRSTEIPYELRKAIAVAEEWVTLVDHGNFSRIWDLTAPARKSANTETEWFNHIKEARATFQAVVSRQVVFAEPRNPAQIAKDARIVIRFYSEFENGRARDETLVLIAGSDGSWKVSEYSVN